MAPGNTEKAEKKEENAVLEQLHAAISELATAALEGDLDTRADSTQFKGAAQQIVEDINRLIDAYAGPIKQSVGYIEQIAQGDAPSKIDEDYQGEFKRIKDSINTCIDVNEGLLTEFATMMEGVMEGQLDVRGRPESLPGGWGQFVEVINNMVDQFVGPFRLTAQYVARISKGDIPEKIEDTYKGEFNEIKDNLNQTIDALNLLLRDMQQTIDAQKEGDIEARCNPGLFQGSYAELSQGINDTLQAVIDPVIESIGIMSKFAEGNFENAMRELPGKQVVLTNGLNGIRRNLLSLIEEINTLIGAAVAGDLNARAEADSHTGEFKRILQGFNDTLDAVIKPVQEANEVLQGLAQGNLTLRVMGDYQGDHALIKDAINSAMDNLHEVLSGVTENSMMVASSSAQLASASNQMAAGAEEQTAQTGEVATAVEEMTATITEVARNASSAAEGSKEAMSSAQQGGDVVRKTIDGMNSIAATVTQAAQTIGELGKRADEIGEIVGVVDDIADQTNLLALNAAIEAARAGEHGRGFAVVADEVRKLAEKTTDATKEVAKVIKAIQKETQQAVHAMESGTREVEEGTKLANQAGEALAQIVSGANRVTEMVIQIAAAAEQQSAAAEEIARNVEGINTVARQSAAGAAQSATAAKDLSGLAERLQSGITRFRLHAE